LPVFEDLKAQQAANIDRGKLSILAHARKRDAYTMRTMRTMRKTRSA